jgi:hypothetical protein
MDASYAFWEMAGETIHDYANSYDGTIEASRAGMWTKNSLLKKAGAPRVIVAHNTVFDYPDSFSQMITCTVYDTIPYWGKVIQKYTANDGYEINMSHAGTGPSARIWTTSGQSMILSSLGDANLIVGKTYTLCTVWDKPTLEFYVNGESYGTVSIDESIVANTSVINIGDSTDSNNLYFQQAFFCSDPFTSSQVKHLAENPYMLWQRVAPISFFFPSAVPEGILNMSGAINAIAATLGQIKKTAKLDGSALGVGSVSGNISNNRPFSGSATATADATGQMSVAKTLSGEITGEADVSGLLSVSRALSGSVGATADVQGQITLQGIIQLSGSIGSVADVVGVMALKRALSGNVNATADVNGQLSAIRRLSGMVDASADVQGSVSIFSDTRIRLSGNISAMAAVEGAVNVAKGVTGQIVAFADVDGQTSLKLNLTGSAEAIADVIGTLRVIGAGSLGVVIDPVLTSVTQKRILRSITKKYFINSI